MTDPLVLPMSSPDLTEAESAAVLEVLNSRFLSIGPKIEAFEQAMAAFIGARHAVGVSSGTTGLHLAVIAAGVQQGDLVITTPFSFVASANVILYENAVPIFVDVEPVTGNIDPAQVATAVADLQGGGQRAEHWLPPTWRGQPNSRREIKAILPVHTFGQPAAMDAIAAIAQSNSLTVIEDACEAIGAEYHGRKAGVFGNAAVFAFYPNKQMTTGEGGIIVTNDDEWAALFRSLRNQGRDVFDAWLNHSRLGYNYRLNEMSAALGIVQLARLPEMLAKRARVASWYSERLADLELIQTPTIVDDTTVMSWFVYVVRVRPPLLRDVVVEQLRTFGIPGRPYFSPIHLQPFYRQRFGYQRGDFPITESLGDVSLALPFSSVMTESQVDQVCGRLRQLAR